MAQQFKLYGVTGGLAGCAVAVRIEKNGLANDNQRLFVRNLAYLPANLQATNPPTIDAEWPEGLRHHTAVLMNVDGGMTNVRVTCPIVAHMVG
jgi:hypothetical protein